MKTKKRKIQLVLDGVVLNERDVRLTANEFEKLFENFHKAILEAQDLAEFTSMASPPFNLEKEYERLGGDGKSYIVHPDYPLYKFTKTGWCRRRWLKEPYEVEDMTTIPEAPFECPKGHGVVEAKNSYCCTTCGWDALV